MTFEDIYIVDIYVDAIVQTGALLFFFGSLSFFS